MKKFSKQVSVETNTGNNNGAVFSTILAEELQDGQKECLIQLSFDTVASKDMSLGAEALKLGTETSELSSAVQFRAASQAVKRRPVL